jgi:hypothetical protein
MFRSYVMCLFANNGHTQTQHNEDNIEDSEIKEAKMEWACS